MSEASFRELQYFIVTAEKGSLSKAAEALGISQSTISMALQRLGKTFERKLFFRSKNGIEITPFGRVFLERAKELVESWEDLHREVQRSVTEMRASFRIACALSVGQIVLPHVLRSLILKYP